MKIPRKMKGITFGNRMNTFPYSIQCISFRKYDIKKFILYECTNLMHSIEIRGIYNPLTVTTLVIDFDTKKKLFYR